MKIFSQNLISVSAQKELEVSPTQTPLRFMTQRKTKNAKCNKGFSLMSKVFPDLK